MRRAIFRDRRATEDEKAKPVLTPEQARRARREKLIILLIAALALIPIIIMAVVVFALMLSR